MRIPSIPIRNLALAAAILSVITGVWTTSAAEKMKPMKGGEHLLMLNQVETVGQAEALKPDDTFAMVCAKCKTVFVTRVVQGTKGAQVLATGGQPTELIGTHGCAGCNSTVEITGHGKGKERVLKHSCKACGDESAFCCATKPGGPTKGMEKK
jgi:formate-dependent nitrite reductase cytochrome c552 subunit